ncbi:hypothetical protein [Allofrancisella frigidaquae]|uniref:hypothetical protein n=1 Tax=Allofrancisella frigidaquae TaxID=1085644 RepID=UPI00155257BA|nr:hypothetical protein [Allofrancisella frigidaquae]
MKKRILITGINSYVGNKFAESCADNWMLFFNGDDNYELIAEDDEILDNEYFNLFIRDL